MNNANANSPALKADEIKSSGEGWPWRKMIFLIALAAVAHTALIYFFGTKRQIIPRAVANVPHLQLADDNDELVALNNPALFALPNPKDFSSAVWLEIPAITPPSLSWTEPPQWLPLNPQNLGATFYQFMRTNRFAEIRLDLKPQPKLAAPSVNTESALPQNSTLKILSALARRGLTQPAVLPALPDNNVIPPSKIQALVDAAGNVISAVLLPDNDSLTAADHSDLADRRALAIARSLHFARAAAPLTLGEIIFNWRTVPMISTNAPANP